MTDDRMPRPEDSAPDGAVAADDVAGAGGTGIDDVVAVDERQTPDAFAPDAVVASDAAAAEYAVVTEEAVTGDGAVAEADNAAAAVVSGVESAPDAHPGAALAPPVVPAVEPVSPDVDVAAEASPLPGAHRGGFSRLPTAPVAVTVQTAPAEPGSEYAPEAWAPADPSSLQQGLSAWALGFAILGLIVSLFVGWGFPIGLVAVVVAIVALRRPVESRAIAIWALVIGTVSILYSAGWLLYAGREMNLFG